MGVRYFVMSLKIRISVAFGENKYRDMSKAQCPVSTTIGHSTLDRARV